MAVGAGEHMTRIIDMAREAGEKIVQIAAAATEQTASMASIRESVDWMAKLGQSTSQGAKSTMQACGKLSDLANRLQALIEQFHLGEQRIAA